MMGGHLFREKLGDPETISDEKLVQVAKEGLSLQLGISQEPEEVKVSLHRKCIPQYHVGHHKTLQAIKAELVNEFEGKLVLIGSSYLGVGVNDCIYHARRVAASITEPSLTGLDTAF